MIQATIQRLTYLTEFLPDQFSQFSEAEMSQRPAPDKWSKREILGHLIDSAANNHRRFVLVQIEPQPYLLVRYAQVDWVRINNYNKAPTNEVINLWKGYNLQIIRVISQIPDEVLQYHCHLGDQEPVTLGWLIDDYLAHMEHHLRQIFPGFPSE
jgi:hypothetical protein